MNFVIDQCITCLTGGPITGVHRILLVDAKTDRLVTIPMKIAAQMDVGWVQFHSLSKFLELEQEHPGLFAKVAVPARFIQSLRDEAAVREKFPPQGDAKESAPIEAKNRRKALVAKIVFDKRGHLIDRNKLFDKRYLQRSMKEALQGSKTQATTLRRILRTFFRWCSTESALYPDRELCGANGKQRNPKKKVGRRNLATLRGLSNVEGYVTPEEERLRIAEYWSSQLNPATNAKRIWSEYSAVYHHRKVELIDGRTKVTLKAPHLRPTQRQFERAGKQGDARLSARILRLNRADYKNNVAPMNGGARTPRNDFGSVFMVDATPSDRVYRCVFDRNLVAGPGNRIILVESELGMIVSIHNFFGAANIRELTHALYIAAASKKALGEELGLPELNDENFLSFLPRLVRGDHGEAFSNAATDLFSEFKIRLQYPEANLARGKGGVEATHKKQRRTDHHDPGTNFGRQRKRGEPDPTMNSCTNTIEHSRALWKAAYTHNCVEPVPHLVPLEMRQDYSAKGRKLIPTRIHIARWLIETGRVGYSKPDISKLRSHLLPVWRARRYRDGIRLLRQDIGNETRTIKRLLYKPENLNNMGWAEELGRTFKPIDVYIDPSHPRDVWYLDRKHGLVECEADPEDPLILAECTLADIIQIDEEDRWSYYNQKSDFEQALVDEIVDQNEVIHAAKAEVRAGQRAAGKKPSRTKLREAIPRNQRREKQEMAQRTAKRLIKDAQASARAATNDNSTAAKPKSIMSPKKKSSTGHGASVSRRRPSGKAGTRTQKSSATSTAAMSLEEKLKAARLAKLGIGKTK